MPNPLPPPWDRFVPFVQKMTVWIAFFAILWFLRPFFFLVFMTFVFGYMLEHFVELTDGKAMSRRFRVILGFMILLALLVGIGWLVAPDLGRQAAAFPGEIRSQLAQFESRLAEWRTEKEWIRDLVPADFKVKDAVGEIFGSRSDSNGVDSLPAPTTEPSSEAGGAAAANSVTDPKHHDSGSANVLLSILPLAFRLLGSTLAVGSFFLLSLLFSFLIVLDLPNLANGARHLRDTRLRFVYDEVSDNVFRFGRVLGQALEAQLMIAILNTALTAIGLYLFKMPNIAFLSAVVFICSFIPVAGVFISSVPICLQTLTVKGDFVWVLYMIGFITLIHMIEAYILNPRIYGAHLKMNPVLVLSILVITHHLFGMWGLVLGVPVTTYVYKHVICGRSSDAEDEEVDPEAAAG